jgi:hypothetical protein
MTTAYGIIAQAAPDATTDTDLYTVPSGTELVGSTLYICNRGATATTFRVALRPDGATITDAMYIAYDVPVAANDTTTITTGLTLDATDKITVYAGNANLSFNLSGAKIT